MPVDHFFAVKGQPIRECRALCGCTLAWVLCEAIDTEGPQEGGRFLWGSQPVIVPCEEGLDHVVLMREAWTEADEHYEIVDLEQVLREFEKLREER